MGTSAWRRTLALRKDGVQKEVSMISVASGRSWAVIAAERAALAVFGSIAVFILSGVAGEKETEFEVAMGTGLLA